MKPDSKITVIHTFCCILFYTSLFSQIPVDNPYYTRYKVRDHWTDTIKWTSVTNVSEIKGFTDEQAKVNPFIFNRTLKDISTKGGGVMYFPAGKYYFDFDINMLSGVVLRGEDLRVDKDATMNGYRPLTQFIFPKYVPSFEGQGTPDSTAFKKIQGGFGSEGKVNCGLVNLDINRATIDFRKEPQDVFDDNIIIFGLRLNNAAESKMHEPVNEKQAWQRLPLHYRANINVIVGNNALIANCKINDSVTDDFGMPNFMTNDGYVFVEDTIKFQYARHTCIGVGRSKMSIAPKLEILDNDLASSNPQIEKITVYLSPAIKSGNKFRDLPSQELVDENGLYSRILQDSVINYFEKKKYLANSKDTLNYFLLKPVNYDPKKKYPLVLFFHGMGENGLDKNPLVHFVYMFTRKNAINKHPCFVVVPQLDSKKYASWKENLDAPISLVKELMEDYSVDKQKMIVSGLSAGGKAVWDVTLQYPKLFSTALLLSSLTKFSEQQLEKVKDIFFIINSGTHDEYIPKQYYHLMVSNLRKAGAKVEHLEYNTRHLACIPLALDKDFPDILFKKRR